MSTAAETREAIKAHPFMLTALRAGVLNYSAAARFLDIEDVDAGAAALRRMSEEFSDFEARPPEYRIRMESGLGPVGSDEDPLVSIGDTAIAPSDGSWTAIIAEGHIESRVVGNVLIRFADEDITPIAVAFDEAILIVVVDRAVGPSAIRIVEGTLSG